MLTVCLILAIAKMHKLDSKAIDFVLAFPQADLEEDIWMHLPIGFTFRNAMKQDDKLEFVNAMEKEISDHEKGKQWSIIHCNTLPHKTRLIKSIWFPFSFEGPDGFYGRALCGRVSR